MRKIPRGDAAQEVFVNDIGAIHGDLLDFAISIGPNIPAEALDFNIRASGGDIWPEESEERLQPGMARPRIRA